jgi:hypothetical protein
MELEATPAWRHAASALILAAALSASSSAAAVVGRHSADVIAHTVRSAIRPAVHIDAPRADVWQRSWEFEAYLDGRRIGQHRFFVHDDGARKRVRSEAEFDVRVLFVPVFRYRHEATEVWEHGCLRELEAFTRENGRETEVRAGPAAGGTALAAESALAIQARDEAGSRAHSVNACASSFAYWDRALLEHRPLVNAQTGEPIDATIERLGPDPLLLDGVEIAASRYRLMADAQEIQLWYDEQGTWIGLATTVDGRRLEYRLHRYDRRVPARTLPM